jgi:hypothetical protein
MSFTASVACLSARGAQWRARGVNWGAWAIPLALGILMASNGVAAAQSDDTVDGLNARVVELRAAGKYAEAVSIAPWRMTASYRPQR